MGYFDGLKRGLCMTAAVAVVASGCARNEDASGLPDDTYCASVRAVEDAVEAHLAAYLEVDVHSGRPEGGELAELSRAVVAAADEAGALAGAEATAEWDAFSSLYRRLARTLDRRARPLDAILDLEEGAVEWSTAADAVSSQIRQHARLWCAFDPELGDW